MSRSGKYKCYYQHQQDRNSKDFPSFSSTLLDTIYRSFDENFEEDEKRSRIHRKEQGSGAVSFKETAQTSDSATLMKMMKVKKSSSSGATAGVLGEDDENDSRSRVRSLDRWNENEKTELRRKSAKNLHESDAKLKNSINDRRSYLASKLNLKSSSTSSESSYGGRGFSFSFSSSDAESFSSSISSSSNSSSLKPIRVQQADYQKAPPKHDRSTAKTTTRSRAMKIYCDLKAAKQPISPGGKLASFLNSIFNAAAAAKKTKRESKSKPSSHSSPCSTASSFSRSCLSKTPSSSAARLDQNGVKRSVRFCPESVAVSEDCSKREEIKASVSSAAVEAMDEEFKIRIEERRRIEEVARDLLKNYRKKADGGGSGGVDGGGVEVEDEEEEEDDVSCCSSDLFELDNFLEIGVDRFSQELPVYETTNLDTNRAIASGLMVYN